MYIIRFFSNKKNINLQTKRNVYGDGSAEHGTDGHKSSVVSDSQRWQTFFYYDAFNKSTVRGFPTLK